MFPLMEGAEFEGLFADIQKHGLREPITIYEDKILDGRNRERAAVEAGVELTFDCFSGSHAEAKAFVISKNIHRRHLTLDQKRELAAQLFELDPTKSALQVAKSVKISPTTAVKIRRDVSKMETSVDTDGRRQPASKARKAPVPKTRKSKARKTPVSKTQKSPKAQAIEEQQIRNVELNADFSPPALGPMEDAPESYPDAAMLLVRITRVLQHQWDTRDQLITMITAIAAVLRQKWDTRDQLIAMKESLETKKIAVGLKDDRL
jgi:YD repeat-containing protein